MCLAKLAQATQTASKGTAPIPYNLRDASHASYFKVINFYDHQTVY
jgi:hypothetical protein